MMDTAPASPIWSVQREAEELLTEALDELYARSRGLSRLAAEALARGGLRLRDLIDSLACPEVLTADRLQQAGWRNRLGVWTHTEGGFPDVLDDEAFIALRCESLEVMQATRGLEGGIEGGPLAPFRRAVLFSDPGVRVEAVERNGHAGHGVPPASSLDRERAAAHLQAFGQRQREFASVADGLGVLRRRVETAVDDLGPDWTCSLFLAAERQYWLQRCHAARVQKTILDSQGFGCANIDHHTYDCSREAFADTIEIFRLMGYELRERMYAGDQAGWGSQILEQPALRSTIFADIDLAPAEVDVDFRTALPPLPRHRRAGLWCAMHGESILDGGLNHVALLFDRRRAMANLEGHGVGFMEPFSDFPHLYQVLSLGDRRPVREDRLRNLQQAGHLTSAEAATFRAQGAIHTHLEVIERNHGFKGFNQPGIDGVLAIIDPRRAAAP